MSAFYIISRRNWNKNEFCKTEEYELANKLKKCLAHKLRKKWKENDSKT